MYIFDANAFYLPQKKIFFRFSIYGCWEITQDLHFESSSCDVTTDQNNELAIDVIEHRVYEPRIHYFIFDIPSPFKLSDIYVVVRYDGSSASVEKFNVFPSLKKSRKFIQQDTCGLKRRV